MKYLPCTHCKQPALASRDGVLHTAGRVSSPVIDYLCRRCGRVSSITSRQFSSLPDMTPEEIADSSCDLPYDPDDAERARAAVPQSDADPEP